VSQGETEREVHGLLHIRIANNPFAGRFQALESILPGMGSILENYRTL
jgi:hypothetical protein